MKFLKPALFLAGGILWLLFGIGFAIFLWQFLTNGAGLQLFGNFVPAVSSGSILFGLIYFTGFAVAAVICFAVGIYLLVRTNFK
jgi:hypothetical protein